MDPIIARLIETCECHEIDIKLRTTHNLRRKQLRRTMNPIETHMMPVNKWCAATCNKSILPVNEFNSLPVDPNSDTPLGREADKFTSPMLMPGDMVSYVSSPDNKISCGEGMRHGSTPESNNRLTGNDIWT